MGKVIYIRAPKDLTPHLRGLYDRVARELGVDPSYVSRVARGESQSALVECALRDDLNKIMAHVNKKNDLFGRKLSGKNDSPKKRAKTRMPAKAT